MDLLPEQMGQSLPQTGTDSLGDKEVVCAQHGAYRSAGVLWTIGRMSREVWTPCPDCTEAKLAAERKAEAEAQAVRARARMAAMIDDAAVPARFIGRTLASYVAETDEQRAALDVATEYAANFPAHLKRGDSLIFLGAPGTGKSHLATAILQAILPEHVGLYTTCAGIIRAVRNTWGGKAERTESQVLAVFADVPLLVIDEIGVQYGTESEQNILFEILDRRYREMRPTILLANLKLKRKDKDDPAGLFEVLGERIYDRLTECATVVTFKGESYRRRAREVAA